MKDKLGNINVINVRSPEDCILEVVLIVSPKRQYRGILDPTTPATIFPKALCGIRYS